MSDHSFDTEHQVTIDRMHDADIEKSLELSSVISNLNNLMSEIPIVSSSSDNILITEEQQKKMLATLIEQAREYVPDIELIEETSLIQIEQVLEKATEEYEKSLAFSKGCLNDNEKELKRLEREAEQLEKIHTEIMGETNVVGDKENHVMKIRNIGNNINKEFKTTREDLHSILTELYPNEEMKNLLADLTAKFFQGGDMYIKVENNQILYINTLLQANLVERHPNELFKFRLRNFL